MCMKMQSFWCSQIKLKKKKRILSGLWLILKHYYKAIVIKRTYYFQEGKHSHQLNSIKNPEIDPHLCSQLILTKAKWLNKGNNGVFRNGPGNIDYAYKKINLAVNSYLTKTNLKWVIYLKVRAKNI